MKEIRLFYCEKHDEWWSSNCSECMIEFNKPIIEKEARAETLKEVAKWGDEACTHNIFPIRKQRHECWQCWSELGELPK